MLKWAPTMESVWLRNTWVTSKTHTHKACFCSEKKILLWPNKIKETSFGTITIGVFHWHMWLYIYSFKWTSILFCGERLCRPTYVPKWQEIRLGQVTFEVMRLDRSSHNRDPWPMGALSVRFKWISYIFLTVRDFEIND